VPPAAAASSCFPFLDLLQVFSPFLKRFRYLSFSEWRFHPPLCFGLRGQGTPTQRQLCVSGSKCPLDPRVGPLPPPTSDRSYVSAGLGPGCPRPGPAVCLFKPPFRFFPPFPCSTLFSRICGKSLTFPPSRIGAHNPWISPPQDSFHPIVP